MKLRDSLKEGSEKKSEHSFTVSWKMLDNATNNPEKDRVQITMIENKNKLVEKIIPRNSNEYFQLRDYCKKVIQKMKGI